MNVIIYARVSTEIQDFERQVQELKAYANKENYKVVDVVSEKISGKVPYNKRKLAQVLESENVDGILIWEFSRIGRNTLDVLNIIEILNDKKVWVHSHKENLKTLDDNLKPQIMTTFMLTLLSSIAQMERGTIVSRSLSGLQNTVKQGNWTGGNLLPYGYRREDKKLVIDEEEAEVIKYIFDLAYKHKHGTKRIASFLNADGIKTRYNKEIGDREIKTKNGVKRNGLSYKWVDGTIYSILKNPIYINEKWGNEKKNLKNIKFEVPPIISKEVFYEVQKQMSKRSNKSGIKYDYLLQNISLKCGVCGKTYYPHRRKSSKDNTYKCLSIRYGHNCGNAGIGIPRLDSGIITAITNNKENIRQLIESNKTEIENKEKFKMLFENNQIVLKELSESKLKKEKLVDLYLDNMIDKPAYNKKVKELEKDIKKLENELIDLDNKIKYYRELTQNKEDVKSVLNSFENDKGMLKNSLSKMIDEVKIYPLKEHNLDEVFTAKNDRVVFIKIDLLFSSFPLEFIISQRTDKIYYLRNGDTFNRDTFTFTTQRVGEGRELERIDY